MVFYLVVYCLLLFFFFFLMIRRPPRSTRTDTLFPYTTLFRSDFQVKGVITAVRPGPVVTMYELEPAPGTKASRVSNLADDIARNMSALSARIASIPGRPVIGIELPTAQREAVVQHEMIGTAFLQEQTRHVPITMWTQNLGPTPLFP